MKRAHLLALAACLLLSTVVLAANPAVAATSDQAPPQLAGIWHHVFLDGFDQRLVLAGTRFAFFGDSANGQAVGDIVVNGDTITFSNSNQCSGSGTYQGR
jgi:hypothetical protein